MLSKYAVLMMCVVLSQSALSSTAQNTQLPVAMAANDALPSAPLPVNGVNFDLPLEQQPHAEATVRDTPKHALTDLTHIAISPIYLRKSDLKWLLPLTGASIAAFATDTHTMNDVVSKNPSFNDPSINVSNGLRDGFIAVPVAMFGVGQWKHNDRVRETGILGSEAMFDAIVVDEFTKLVTFRERPYVDNAQGEFYVAKAGVDSSFVSGHSMIAWSSAAVLAGESHSKWADLAIYSAATGVAATRVMGQQHFPTDVLIGSAGGWLIGHFVYRAHHHADAIALK